MLFLTSLAWGLGLAALVTLPPIGFSIEIGGFLAGIAMADSVQHLQISSRIKSLRDFFIVMFFVVLGSRMVFGDIGSVWVPTAVLSLFVLIGNPLIVMAIMGALGFRSRTAFLSSVTVAQISEFSMILAALGHRLGHIDGTTVALVTAVGIITITLSSYMIIYDEAIYKALRPMLKVFEFRPIRQEESVQSHGVANHMVLIGCHRMGQNILASLEELHKEFVVVDFNPDIVAGLKAKGIRTVYGDVSDPDIQDACGLTRARAVISTVPNFDDSLAVLEAVKSGAGKAKVILTAETELEAERLYKAGADYVLLPHFIGGLQLAQTIRDDKNLRTLTGMRRQDLGIIGKHL
jgi:voltage-gated potassium channel Kch